MLYCFNVACSVVAYSVYLISFLKLNKPMVILTGSALTSPSL